MTPGPWTSLLLLGAAFRTWRLIGIDVIFDRPRDWITRANTPRYKERLDDFLACPWCLGMWLVFAWWAFWLAWHAGATFCAAPLAISAGVGIVRNQWDR